MRHIVGSIAEIGQSQTPNEPFRSAIVCKSASTWHGWNSLDSALTTGTDAAEAKVVKRS